MSSPRYSRFEALLLPPIIAQSMMIGGAYATGREIMQYAGRFGPAGWLAVLIIFGGMALLSVLAFELARVGKVYDYKRWIRLLIGPLWPLFDLLGIVMLLLVLSVMSAAIGSVLRQTIGVPFNVGLLTAFVGVGFLAWKGTAVMERFKTIGSIALYLAYIAFAIVVLSSPNVTSATAPEPVEAASTGEIVVSAVQYVGYNLAVFPPVLFCLYRQRRRSETVASGVLAGAAVSVPFALTFVCLLRFWPDPAIVDAEVPWLPMLERAAPGGGPWLILFGIVVGWTLLETAVGGIHAVVDRIEQNLGDLPQAWRPAEGTLKPLHKTIVSLAVLGAATLLAQIGIIDLVARGYSALAWGYIVLLAIPLLTVGVVRIARSS